MDNQSRTNFKDLGIIPQDAENPFDNLDKANRMALALKEALRKFEAANNSFQALEKKTKDKTAEETVAILKQNSEIATLLDTLNSIVDNVIKDYQLEVARLNG